MTTAGNVSRYPMLSVDSAPPTPGLYAWYVIFDAGKPDWETRPEDGHDAAIDGFQQLVRTYSTYHEPLPIALKGISSYQVEWGGHIENRFSLRQATHDSQTDAEAGSGRLAQATASETRRRVLADILAAASPVFSSPVYIGVAENLRDRLKTHRRDFANATEYLQGNPDDSLKMKSRGKSFGYRAAARGIAMENLVAWVMDLGELVDPDTSVDTLREIAESAEWILHRLYSPILGRR